MHRPRRAKQAPPPSDRVQTASPTLDTLTPDRLLLRLPTGKLSCHLSTILHWHDSSNKEPNITWSTSSCHSFSSKCSSPQTDPRYLLLINQAGKTVKESTLFAQQCVWIEEFVVTEMHIELRLNNNLKFQIAKKRNRNNVCIVAHQFSLSFATFSLGLCCVCRASTTMNNMDCSNAMTFGTLQI